MATQAERSAATRARLLQVGQALFARDGYEATSTDALLREAGISKGALYHQYASKRELFEAVFETVAEDSIRRALARAPTTSSALNDLIEGGLEWLREVRRAEVATILLEEGPRVLGFLRARDLEAKTSLGLMKRGLERAVAAGEVSVPSVELAARMLNAVLAEAALVSLQSGRRVRRGDIEATVRRLFEAFAKVT